MIESREQGAREDSQKQPESRARKCSRPLQKKYIFAKQVGYKEGHIRGEISSSRERADIAKYISAREALRAKKDLLRWEDASHKNLVKALGGDKENEEGGPFGRAIKLLHDSSSAKKSRKTLGKLMAGGGRKIDFGSEAKQALRGSRKKVAELVELCEDSLRRRLGKTLRM